jgi:hypothetical protein
VLEISNNSTSIYRSCPKKYYWRYLRGLSPYKKSAALTLGSVIHSAFDMYYNGFSDVDVLEFINKTTDEEIAKSSPEISESLVIAKYTALAMWINYPKDLSAFSEIKPELELTLEFSDGVSIVLKIDGLVKIDGKLWVRELKTTALSFGQFEQRCETSHQCSLYTYAVRKSGFPVEGVIYDFIKKPLLRKHIKEDKDQFGQRIVNNYKERPDYYYKRHYSYRSQENLELFEQDLQGVVRDMKLRVKSGDWYRNPDACWTFNSACPYMPICFQKNPDQLTLDVYYRHDEINPKKGGTKCQKQMNKKQ